MKKKLDNRTGLLGYLMSGGRDSLFRLCVAGAAMGLFIWFHLFPSVIIPGAPDLALWIYLFDFSLLTVVLFGIIWLIAFSILYTHWLVRVTGLPAAGLLDADSRTYFPLTLLYLDFFRFEFLTGNMSVFLLLLSLVLVVTRKIISAGQSGITISGLTAKLKGFVNDENRSSISFIVFTMSFPVFCLLGSGLIVPLFPLTGDEPAYLMITDSMVFDKDLKLYNNFRDNQHLERFTKQAIKRLPTHTGNHYPHHGIGLSLLLLPFYYAGWDLNDFWFQFVLRLPLFFLAAVFITLMYHWFSRYFNNPRLTFWYCVMVIFSAPLLFYSRQFYPELPVGVLTLIILQTAFSGTEIRSGRLFISALCLGCFPWFGIKYLALATGLILVLFIRLLQTRSFTARNVTFLVLPFLLLLSLFFRYQITHYGNLSLINKYVDRLPTGAEETLEPTFTNVLKTWQYTVKRAVPRMIGYFLDQRHGILLYSPVLILLFVGIFHELRTRFKVAVLLFIPIVFHLGLYASYGSWGGYAPPTRPLVPLFSIISYFSIRGLCESMERKKTGWIVLLWGISLWLAVIFLQHPGWLLHEREIYHAPDRSQFLTALSSPLFDLTGFFPSFFGPWQYWNWASNFFWIILIIFICQRLIITPGQSSYITEHKNRLRLPAPAILAGIILLFCLIPALTMVMRKLHEDTDFSALMKNRIFEKGLAGAYYYDSRWSGIPRFIILEPSPHLDRAYWSELNAPRSGLSIKWNGAVYVVNEGTYTVHRFPYSNLTDIRIDGTHLEFSKENPVETDITLDAGFHGIRLLFHSDQSRGFRSALLWQFPGAAQPSQPPMYVTDENTQMTETEKDSILAGYGTYFETVGDWAVAISMYNHVTTPRMQKLKQIRLRTIYNQLISKDPVNLLILAKMQRVLFDIDKLKSSYGTRVYDPAARKSGAVQHLADKQQPGIIAFTAPQEFPVGSYTVDFRIKVSGNTLDEPVIRLEAFSTHHGGLAQRILRGTDFDESYTYQSFPLSFYNLDDSSPTQFIVITYGKTDAWIDQINFLPTIPQYLIPPEEE